MQTLTVLLNSVYHAITSAFSYAEALFSSFGISLLLLAVVFFTITFFVSKFVSPFFR